VDFTTPIVMAIKPVINKLKSKVKPEPPQSRAANAVMLLEPVLKQVDDGLIKLLVDNAAVIATIVDRSPTIQGGFDEWLIKVNRLPK